MSTWITRCYAEVRDAEGQWQVVADRIFPHDGGDINGPFSSNEPIEETNYDLFAVLTGQVRNTVFRDYIGISDRDSGLPDDISEWVRGENKADSALDMSYHPYWLSLHEIQEYDWDRPTETGLIPRKTCEWFLERTVPALESLIPEGGSAHDVRIIFWFDQP